jgi:Uma2 family endonuclease
MRKLPLIYRFRQSCLLREDWVERQGTVMALSDNFENMSRADRVPGPGQGNWTYSTYCAIPEDGRRYEIVGGVLYMAPPSPSGWHQEVVGSIYYHLKTHVQYTGLGKVYIAPFDVELENGTVVQPDVCVLLRENEKRYIVSRIVGGPDLVVEVSSPATALYDRRQKYMAYARAGVREYWLVEPKQKSIEVFFLEQGSYQSQGVFREAELVPTRLVPHFPVRAEECFE